MSDDRSALLEAIRRDQLTFNDRWTSELEELRADMITLKHGSRETAKGVRWEKWVPSVIAVGVFSVIMALLIYIYQGDRADLAAFMTDTKQNLGQTNATFLRTSATLSRIETLLDVANKQLDKNSQHIEMLEPRKRRFGWEDHQRAHSGDKDD